MNYVGIDHHRQYPHMTVMDQMGQVLRSGRVPNLQNEIGKFLEDFEVVKAVIETGRSSYTMVDVLEEMGIAVKIAHPNEVKAIARAKIKTDKRDSEVLAHLLLEFIARVTSHIPDKGQVTVRYFGLYANAHWGKVRKMRGCEQKPILIEEECSRIPRRGWAEMIRKVFEVDPLTCPKCQSQMRIIAFLTDYAVVDRIIAHLKLTFVAERPPPPHLASQEFLMDSEASADYFFMIFPVTGGEVWLIFGVFWVALLLLRRF